MPEARRGSYIPNSDTDSEDMLRAIEVDDLDDLFKDIPPQHRNPPLNLPPPLSELELRREMEDIASRNISLDGKMPSFLGGGRYRHYIPAAVDHIVGNPSIYTSYTPYQAEVSQGNLWATFELQSILHNLLGNLPVVTAGHYSGATAAAEGVLMTHRMKRDRNVVMMFDDVSPEIQGVIETYCYSAGIEISTVSANNPPEVKDNVASVVIQNPNFFGYFRENLAEWVETAHQAGAYVIASQDPMACGLFKPAFEYGVDVVVGDGQPLGIPLNFGGPSYGIFACTEEFLHARQVPGRLVGRTKDSKGRDCVVLIMTTREQHIKRARATSNITTNSAHNGFRMAAYLALMGSYGLNKAAELSFQKAHYAARQIDGLEDYSVLPGRFFKEFVVQCPIEPVQVNQKLYEAGIIGGIDVSDRIPNGLLICVTEMNTKEEIDWLVQELAKIR
ncbi:aminomethyl-transferring glycine dehydrogenase subunit GcvPA [Candidatus Microgenomates bacterium]|nr:aminomethyl-transferring glycine dehydrogenase subunit GcvPA [Candidatus Microgenomates bacterium]